MTPNPAFGKLDALIYSIHLDELGLPVSAVYDDYTYSVSAVLDFEGDGTVLFPDKPIEKKGAMQRYLNDLLIKPLN